MRQRPVAKQQNIVMQELDGETVLYNLETDKAFCLNQTSAIVWKNCNGKNDISAISSIVSTEMQQLIGEEVVELAIEQLKNEGLLENPESVHTAFAGLSRREVVKKIGFASAVALPLITSLVAPVATQAQSTCLVNGTPRTCPNAPGCSTIPVAPGVTLIRCPDAICCSGFCARDITVAVGNCAA